MTYLLGNGFVEFSPDTIAILGEQLEQMNLKTSGLIAKQDLIILVDVGPMTMSEHLFVDSDFVFFKVGEPRTVRKRIFSSRVHVLVV